MPFSMPRTHCAVSGLIALNLALSPISACPASQSGLPEEISLALTLAGIAENQIGAYVYDLSTDREILSVNADQAFNPASVMKVLTTFAALDVLGPAYTWKTEAWLDGTLEEGRLEGNLVLKGHGDPKLNLENFWLFLRSLRNRGLRDIRGDLVVDRSDFALDAHDPAQFDNEPSRPYNVGPDALLINYKAFRLQFAPDAAKQTVAISSEPALPAILIVNKLNLGPGDCDAWPEKPAITGNTLTFSGAFPASCGEKSRFFSLLSANEYAATLFRQFWSQSGGGWSGNVRDGTVGTTSTLFAKWESPPLSENCSTSGSDRCAVVSRAFACPIHWSCCCSRSRWQRCSPGSSLPGSTTGAKIP